MNEQIYNDLMQRLDVLSEKFGVVSSELFRQALMWNYVLACLDILSFAFLLGMTIWAWKMKLDGDYEPSPRDFGIFAWRIVGIIMTVISIYTDIPNALMRFSAPTLGVVKIVLGFMGGNS